MQSSVLRTTLRSAGFLAAYLASSWLLAGHVPFPNAQLWLPTGVAVSGLWLLGPRFWPVVLLGTVLHRVMQHYSWHAMIPGAIGNPLEALTAVAILRGLGFRSDFRRLRDVLALVAVALVAPVVSTVVGSTAWITHPDRPGFLFGMWGWWRMNALGILVVFPPVVAWTAMPPRRVRPAVVAESAAMLLAVVGLSALLLGFDARDDQSGMVLSYLALPVAIYGGVRFGVRGAATASAGIVVLLAVATANGVGPFYVPAAPHGASPVRELALQAVMALVMVAPVLFAAVLCEREDALRGVASEREAREELLASIDRAVNEGLFRATARRGLVYVNAGLARMLGHDGRDALLGVTPRSLFIDPGRYEAIAERLRRHGWVHNEEALLRRRDGSGLPVLVSATLVPATPTTPSFVDGAVSDITQRKHLEEQLRESQKMEALGQLAGGVAHDFNNLLTAISGFAECLRDGLPDGSRARSDADEILRASGRAAALTRQLLAYSRRQRLEPQVADLREIVESMSGMLRRLIGENIRFEIHTEGAPLPVRVDRGQMEQVLLNLVVNARDAMPEGGALHVTTSSVTIGPAHPHAQADTPPGPYARLVVEDTGVGMQDDVRRRAFDPFFTTKAPGQGTGLGLSTVFGIVRQSGGLVWIESEPGAGTCVTACLPVSAASPAGGTVQPHALAGPHGGHTVLVVEDEPAVRDLVARTLGEAGYRVLVAEDGERGLALARDEAGRLDLLVTDVVMPRLGGIELASRLASEYPALPVLFVSGYMNDTDDRLELHGPGRSFLQKPFAPSELLERVRRQLAETIAETR